MKKKSKSKSYLYHDRKIQVFKNFEQTPRKNLAKNDPLNVEEQKFKFLYYGITPKFEFRVSNEQLLSLSNKKKGEIHFDLLPEAKMILEKVKQQFGSGENYADILFGPRIDAERASHMLRGYLKENGVEGMMNINWSKDLACSGRMSWVGPCLKINKPEARKYNLWLKDSSGNNFLRERGILCLADHEIGTHFFRMYNDGLQPWFSNRQRFGLQKLKSANLLQTEEGLASVNTILGGNSKYLFFPALLYYTACKATEMTFQELFHDLGQYIKDSDQRWRYVMRVKRHLPDPGDVGGYGKDQCYFAGAVKILRNLDKIDFEVLYSGKVTLNELARVKHTARLDFIKLPHFMQDLKSYIKQLRQIASVNGLLVGKKNKKKKRGSRSSDTRSSKRRGKSHSKSRAGSSETPNKEFSSLKNQSVLTDCQEPSSHSDMDNFHKIFTDGEIDERGLKEPDSKNMSGLRQCFSDTSLALGESQGSLNQSYNVRRSSHSSGSLSRLGREDEFSKDSFGDDELIEERKSFNFTNEKKKLKKSLQRYPLHHSLSSSPVSDSDCASPPNVSPYTIYLTHKEKGPEYLPYTWKYEGARQSFDDDKKEISNSRTLLHSTAQISLLRTSPLLPRGQSFEIQKEKYDISTPGTFNSILTKRQKILPNSILKL